MLIAVWLQYWKLTLSTVGHVFISGLVEVACCPALYENLMTSVGSAPIAAGTTTAPQVPLGIASVGIATVPFALIIAIVPLASGTFKLRSCVTVPLIVL